MLTPPTQRFTHGMVIPLDGSLTSQPISFQWNPLTIKEDRGVNWAHLEPIAREQPILQFSIGQARVISFEMDVSEPGGAGMSAKRYIEQFLELTKPTVGGNVKRPPILRLILGEAFLMTCVLTNVANEYGPIYHPETLGPQQAKIRLTFTEFK